jgi:heat shock protein HslJ
MALICSMYSCKNNKVEKSNSSITINPRISLNWADTYYGVVPCASCSGIVIEITLNTDLSYTMKRTYLDESHVPLFDSGTFTWNDEGTEISLHNMNEKVDFQHFIVQEDKLILLNIGNESTSKSNIRDYTLFKVVSDTSSLFDKQWNLVEIMGEPVPLSGIHKKEAFIYFKSDGTVHGDLGCNTFTGTYTLQNGDRIQFSNVVNTLKICSDMSIESAFIQILEVVDNYSLDDDELVLNRARIKPLARFEANQTDQ